MRVVRAKNRKSFKIFQGIVFTFTERQSGPATKTKVPAAPVTCGRICGFRCDHRSFCQYDIPASPSDIGRISLSRALFTMADFRTRMKWLWRQLLFQMAQRFPQQVTVAGGVYADAVSVGFSPQNVGNGNKENPLLVADHKAFSNGRRLRRDWRAVV